MNDKPTHAGWWWHRYEYTDWTSILVTAGIGGVLYSADLGQPTADGSWRGEFDGPIVRAAANAATREPLTPRAESGVLRGGRSSNPSH